MNKKTLIINYAGLSVGGIEKFIGNIMRHAVAREHRVIWFTHKPAFDNAMQRDVADNPKIEKIFFAPGRRKLFHKSPDIKLTENENVVMISFMPEDYVWAEQFRKKYKCNTFYHHLILMNYFGFLTYPEDEFNNKIISKYRTRFSNRIARILDENDNIRAFNEKQLEAYKNRYNLKLEVSSAKRLKAFEYPDDYSEELLLKNANSRKDEFVISTCARFQFPHKGYILGLLDEFKTIREKYDNVRLIIVGDRECETFNNKLNTLPDFVKDSIELKGILPFIEVVRLYKSSHLVVGLAGSISVAASLGIPALVVRHDTTNCETYGFYQDVESTLKSEPGQEIIPFIEKVITCTAEDYFSIGTNGYITNKKRYVVDPDYILNEKNESSTPSISKFDMICNRMWAIMSLIKQHT